MWGRSGLVSGISEVSRGKVQDKGREGESLGVAGGSRGSGKGDRLVNRVVSVVIHEIDMIRVCISNMYHY
jgi:hypothetical protein